MIILRKRMVEKTLQVGDTFIVRYWDVPVTYKIIQSPEGKVFYYSINSSAEKAVYQLSKIADKTMLEACKKLGLLSLVPGGHTSVGFLPTETIEG